MADKHVCVLCGGAVDDDGRSLALPVPVRTDRRRAPTATPSFQPDDDDPLKHLTPGERYAQAIERRNTLIRDRRTSDRRGRRETDQPPGSQTGTEEGSGADGR